ncbi:hypothetical protein [Thauera sinica]|uniref:Uncharacterized protein n=1 Tax=Thauera sinica TaxID=2665146 RepID=A0ABW1AXS6_9RHOO|nr:hypothetical protein [Thauera sp. K11]ATE58677.1 hypothetical protein CCZ27_00735 [Thauera sp. K11]
MSHSPPYRLACAAAVGVLALQFPPAQAATFGRLFHTPVQRHALEQDTPPEAAIVPPPPPPAPSPPTAPLRIDGILRRSDGQYTVWINGEMAPMPRGLHLPPGRQRVLIPETDPHRHLRVGDRWLEGDRSAVPEPSQRHSSAADDAP